MKKTFYFPLFIAACIGSLFLFKDLFSVNYVAKFGPEFNSKEDDFSPTISNEGQVLLYDTKSDKGDTDIYLTTYQNGGWSLPRPFDEINSEFDEETPFISFDGKMILFASNRDDDLPVDNPVSPNYYKTYDIFITYYKNGDWLEPRRLSGDINTVLNERCPSLSKDNLTIYFSRWEYKHIQPVKIMRGTLMEFTTDSCETLPPVINSGHGDIAMRPADNLDGFFFSSLRPGGYGGWDLYFISYINNKWGTPVNLGPHLNTPWHEMFLARNGTLYYFSSNRRGGVGLYDLYAIYDQNLAINFDQYRKKEPTLSKEENTPVSEPDQTNFPVIYFDFNSAKLLSEYTTQLNEIVSYLKTNAKAKLQITGHTDERGGEDFNCKLSYRRAMAAYNYFISKKINKKRLKIISMGKTKPADTQFEDEQSYSKNRRVEFSIYCY